MNEKGEIYWKEFNESGNFTAEQAAKFEKYYDLLIDWNEKFNLTAITDVKSVINYHYKDSIYISKFIDFENLDTICDVGSGAGFPGIPLKILYPHLSVILIEVNNKKVQFLKMLIDRLDLSDVKIESLDWRTFLRKTDYSIDLFLARASLQPEELIKIFKPGCRYNEATLVYFASQEWQPTEKENLYKIREEVYKVGNKKRKYVFFKKI